MSAAQRLPRDVVGIILQYLPIANAFTSRRVCKIWYQAGRLLVPPLAAFREIELIRHPVPKEIANQMRSNENNRAWFDLQTERFLLFLLAHSIHVLQVLLFSRDGQLLDSVSVTHPVLQSWRMLQIELHTDDFLKVSVLWSQQLFFILSGMRTEKPSLKIRTCESPSELVKIAYGLSFCSTDESSQVYQLLTQGYRFHIYRDRIAVCVFGRNGHSDCFYVFERKTNDRRLVLIFDLANIYPQIVRMTIDCVQDEIVSLRWREGEIWACCFVNLVTLQVSPIAKLEFTSLYLYNRVSFISDGFQYHVYCDSAGGGNGELYYLAVNCRSGRIVQERRWKEDTRQELRLYSDGTFLRWYPEPKTDFVVLTFRGKKDATSYMSRK